MYYADDPLAVISSAPPAPAAEFSALASWFTEGGSALDDATPVHADWLNGVLAALMQVLKAAGVSPVKGVYTTLLQSVLRLTSSNALLVTASAALTADNVGVILADATAGSVTLTLPASATLPTASPAMFLVFRKDTASLNSVQYQPGGSDTIWQASGPVAIPVGSFDLVIYTGGMWLSASLLRLNGYAKLSDLPSTAGLATTAAVTAAIAAAIAGLASESWVTTAIANEAALMEPLSQTGAGVGQWAATGAFAGGVLPAGGTWEYFILGFVSGGGGAVFQEAFSGIAAGGTNVITSGSPTLFAGMCKRIA